MRNRTAGRGASFRRFGGEITRKIAVHFFRPLLSAISAGNCTRLSSENSWTPPGLPGMLMASVGELPFRSRVFGQEMRLERGR
ncbi:hypothetical protein [Streptomyces sp. NPDC046197]|uniref:hypothetical protein n=1 Tax=Streptomyces sp. NPDC046197 TaxID=3154337 RepID=UPI0033C054D5